MLIWLCLGTNNWWLISGSPGWEEFERSFFILRAAWQLISRHIHVAQQVERPAVNRVVEGSSPSVGANKAICAKKQALFSRSPGMALKTWRLSCHPKNGWLANLVKALGWSPREVGSKPTPSTNKASSYNGNYAGLSRRRQGFNSPWGRQRLFYSVLRAAFETGCF